MAEKFSRTLLTPNFRMAFPGPLIEPKPYMQNGKPQGEPKYSVTGIFDPKDLDQFETLDAATDKLVKVDVKRVCFDLAKQKWPDLDIKTAMATTWPIIDGDAYAAKQEAKGKSGDAYKGKKLINMGASQEYPPTLRVVADKKLVILNRGIQQHMTMAKASFVGGYYACAEVNLQPVEVSGRQFVKFYLNNIRFVKEGPRLGGSSLMDRFGGTDGGVSDHNPTAGMDDEIPF